MSYILDALRKAESERQRGQVPGLHDSPAALGLDTAPRARPTPRWLWLLLPLLLLGAAGIGAAAWWALQAPAPVLVQAPAPLPPASPLPAPAAPLPVVVSAPVPVPAPALPPSPASAASVGAPEPRALKFSELSPELQREMPPLVPGGSVWSESAASRFVVLNGQVLREGDTVAPGLVLARIGPRSAQLRWRTYLIEIPL